MELLGPFTIAAGEGKTFAKSGRYIEVIEAGSALDIFMLGPSGEIADEMRGALSGFYAEQSFQQLQIVNRSASTQTITLMITDGRGGSRRQPGIVTVVDQSRARSLNGDSFISSSAAVGVAANFCHLQLSCESTSARRIFIQRMRINASGLCGAYVHIANVNTGWTVTGAPFKKNGDLFSSLECQTRFMRAGFPDIPSNRLMAMAMPANVDQVVELSDPFVLLPGKALFVVLDAAAVTLFLTVEGWAE